MLCYNKEAELCLEREPYCWEGNFNLCWGACGISRSLVELELFFRSRTREGNSVLLHGGEGWSYCRRQTGWEKGGRNTVQTRGLLDDKCTGAQVD